MLSLWMIGQETGAATETPAATDNAWIGWVIGLIVATGAVAAFAFYQRIFEAFMKSEGFSGVTILPEDLQPRETVWLPRVQVSDCWLGRRQGFETAMFKVTVKSGEDSNARRVVGVRRAVFAALNAADIGGYTLDTTSAPGWILVAISHGIKDPIVLRPILERLTAPDDAS